MAHKEPLMTRCTWCGDPYRIKPYEKATSKFCSKTCKMSFLKRNNTIEPCAYCGSPVEVNWKRRNRKHYFCNRDCHNKSVSARVTVTCAGCGEVFTTYASRAGYYRQLYCNQECYIKHGTISSSGYAVDGPYETLRQRLVYTSKYLEWKTSVLIRDNYTCIECGATTDLRVHHKMPLVQIAYRYNPELSLEKINLILESPEFNDVTNGKTLCISCHLKEHRIVPVSSNGSQQTP